MEIEMEIEIQNEIKKCNRCKSGGPFRRETNKMCNKCIDNAMNTVTKCEHGKSKTTCVECGGASLCLHGKQRTYCKLCGGNSICSHGIARSKCKQCDGSSICNHQREKSSCRDCNGTKFCIHDKIKYRCKECKGSSLCEHNVIRSQCKSCDGGGVCEHMKLRTICSICGGGSLCIHNKVKSACPICATSQKCIHDKYKAICKLCKGSQICEHNNVKSKCVDCDGYSVCIHKKQKVRCAICSPQNMCQNCKFIGIKKSYRFYPYCFSCYCVLNPDIEIPSKFKIRENHVRDYIKDKLDDEVTLVFDKTVEDGCSRRRPDVKIDMGSHVIIVECDEEQHGNYSCENKRMMQLFLDIGGNRPIVFLRFNPDSYTCKNVKYKGCFTANNSGLKVDGNEFGKRMDEIIKWINYYKVNVPDKTVTIKYFFYDS